MHLFTSATDESHGGDFSLIHSDSHFGNAIIVPDAELLFTGTFHRSGIDLVLTGHDGRHHVIPGYFANEHPPALMAPNGAHLTPEIVDMLAGSPAPHEYAQAGTTQAVAPDSIGKVQKVTGTVTVLRNGVSVAVNVGDAVYKSDVILTAADSKCGITFPDGTALELLPNTRMALNEYNYDAHSTSNQALFTLIDGTFGFVAGKVAHSGDMKIGTPVATMGIRGTTGVVQAIHKADGTVGDGTYSYSVYDDPGTTTSGWWDMFVQNTDGSEALIATVSQTGYVTFITPQGAGLPPLVTTVPLTASQLGDDQSILQDLFETYALGGPRSIGIPGSGDNPLLQLPPNFAPGLEGGSGPNGNNGQLPGLPSLPPPQNPQGPSGSSNIFIWNGGGVWPTGGDWNQGFPPTAANAIVIVETGNVQYNQNLVIFSLTIDAPAILDMIGGGLQVTNGLDVFGQLLVDGDPPFFASYGTSTIESGGKVVVTGAGTVAEFGQLGAGLVTVNNFGTMLAQTGGYIEFLDTVVTNEAANASTGAPAGLIEADGKAEDDSHPQGIDFTDSILTNAGKVLATHSGGVFFVNTAVTNDTGASITATHHGAITFETTNGIPDPFGISTDLINAGRIRSTDGGLIQFINADVTNTGSIRAHGGTITFDSLSLVTNETTGRIVSIGSDSLITFTGDELDNSGLVRAAWGGTVKFVGADIMNEAANNTVSPALPGGKIEAQDWGRIEIQGGSVSNLSGAVIKAADHGGVFFESTHTDSLEVTNFAGGKIVAVDCGLVAFEDVTVVNDAHATIEAKNYGIVSFFETKHSNAGITNLGTIEAVDHGIVAFVDVGGDHNNGVTNIGGTIEAIGCGAKVELVQSTIDGGTVQTRHGGKIEVAFGDNTFLNVTLNGAIVQIDCHAVLALDGGTSGIALTVDKKDVLEGPGVVTMAFPSYKIVAGADGGTLVNDTTILGTGQILGAVDGGGGALLFVNEGLLKTVDGAHGHIFTIDTGISDSATTINSGTLEASAHAKLLIEDSTVDNTCGVIAAYGHHAVVELIDSTFAGGTFATCDLWCGADGKIEIVSRDANGNANTVTFDGSGQQVTVDGFVQVDPGATLELIGTIDNKGTIDIDGAAGATLAIDGTVKLRGDGVVTLADAADEITGVAGSDAKLENYSNIDGVGSIGGNDLTLINELKGNIVADGGKHTTLTIDTGKNRITNDGTMEAVWLSTLEIDSKLANFGRVIADFGGKVVDTANVVNEAGGRIEALHGGTVTFDDIAKIVNDARDGWVPAGMIMADGRDSKILFKSSTVDNDGKIEAKDGGVVDISSTEVDNQGGHINADGCGSLIVLAGSDVVDGYIALERHGALDVTRDSTLDNVDVTVGGSDRIDVENGAILTLDDGTTISGGTLEIESGSKLLVDSSHGATLDGVDVINHGTIKVDEPSDTTTIPLVLKGDADIEGGKLSVGSAGLVHVEDSGATFDGVKVDVSDGGEIEVGQHGHASGTILIVDDDTIVSGGTLAIDSNGEVDVEAGSAGTGATLRHVDVESSGLIQVEEGAVLDLEGDTIAGGTLNTVGYPPSYGQDGGVIELLAKGGATTFDGRAKEVTVEGYVQVAAGAELELQGRIDLDSSDYLGIIDLYETQPPGSKGSSLLIDGTVTLSGGGYVQLDGKKTSIVGANDDSENPDKLINKSSIYGGGNIGNAGDGTLIFENSGLVQATAAAAGHIVIDTGTTTTNTGTLDGADYSELDLYGTFTNFQGNNKGLIEATGTDGTVALFGATIDGGKMSVGATDFLSVIGGGNTSILDGVAVTDSGAIDVGASTGAILMLEDGASITGNNTGTLTVAAGNALDIEKGAGSGPHSGATLDGLNVTDHGSIDIGDVAPGAILTLDDGTVIDGDGIGKLIIHGGDTLAVEPLGGATLDGVIVTDNGSINVDPGQATLTLDGGTTIEGEGSLTIGSNGTLDVTGGTSAIGVGIANHGNLQVENATLIVNGAVTGTGTDTIGHDGVLDFASTVGAHQTANFADQTGTLDIAHAGDFSGTISGFGDGDTIDLADIAYTPGSEYDVWAQTSTGQHAGGTLTIYEGTTAVETLHLSGTYSTNDFELVGDGAAGTPGTDVVQTHVVSGTTATFTNPASQILFENGHWVVDDGITTLSGVDKVVIGGQTYLLVDHTGSTGGYQSIQTAVDAAHSGDTILVAPGTYTEQVTVGSSLNGLTIESINGANTVTVESPTALAQTGTSPITGNAIDGIFTVNGASNVTITGLTVNGLDYGDGSHFAAGQTNPSLVGIAYIHATGGSIDGVTITGTRESDAGIGDQRNFGIFVVNSDTLAGDIPTQTEASGLNTISITNSTLSEFQKGGIVVEYANATISGNTLTGLGDVNTAQNAIEVRESTGTVSDNTITAIGYSGSTAAATGVLGLDNYNLDITGNSFTGALDSHGNLLLSPVGYYVIDSTTGEITDNTAANVDDGIVVQSEGFGGGDTDEITGLWTVSGNTITDVVPVSEGGAPIYFDPDPTTAGSSFTATGGANDTGDVFFVTPGADALTGGGGGGNTFIVTNGADLGSADSVVGQGTANAIEFVSDTAGDTLTVSSSNVSGVQEIKVGSFDAGGNFVSTATTSLNVDFSAYNGALTVTGNAGNDTFIVNAANNTINGGTGGVNTVHYGATLAASDFAIVGGGWQVSDGQHGTDTLDNIGRVTDGTHTFLLVGDGGFSSIQAAVNAAHAGDTILLAPGTYTEQVTVGSSLNGLTIESINGANTVTVESPTALAQTGASPVTGNAIDGIFTVNGASNVTITGLTVDGLDYGDGSHFAAGQTNPSLVGIAYINATGGSIDGVTITGTRESDAGIGDQRNFGIFVVNNALADDIPTQAEAAALKTISITNSTLSEFQKGGIVVEYANATISGNTLTGLGDVNTAQNAIEVRESTGTVSNNTITDIGYIGTSTSPTGVLGFDNYNLDIAGNSFTGALNGNAIGYYVTDSTGGTIEGNSAANVLNGVVVQSEAFSASDPTTGTWIVSGNAVTDVVPVSQGGAPIYFDPDPTTGGSFTAAGGTSDVGDVFFVSPGTDILTGGGGGDNTFVVVHGSDLSSADTVTGEGTGNTIEFVSGTANDVLTVSSHVGDIQDIKVGAFDANGNFISTGTTALKVDASAYTDDLTITGNNGNDTLIGGSGNDTFIVGSGNNTITGGTGAGTTNTLVYDAPVVASDITYLGSGQYQVTDGLHGTDTFSNIQVVTDGEYLIVGPGAYATVQDALSAAHNGDTIVVGEGTIPSLSSLDFGSLDPNQITIAPANGSVIDLGANAVLEVNGTDPKSIDFSHDGGTGELIVDNAATFTGKITGLQAGDQILLGNTTPSEVTYDGGVLKVDGVVPAFATSALPSGDIFGFQADGPNKMLLEVIPQQVTVTASTAEGAEGTPILINPSASITGNAQINQLDISDIPFGVTLTDGTHSFTASLFNGTSVDLTNPGNLWNLSNLHVTSPNDANFTLTITANGTDLDNSFNFSVSTTEQIIVDPPAPTVSWATTETGVEGSAISLGNLTYGITGASGDSNSLSALTIAGVPKGATLSDGTNHIVSDGSTPIDVKGWTLSNLSVQTVNDSNFTLTATVTEKDLGGNTTSNTATETVTVTPEQPSVAWAAGSAINGAGTIAIGLDVSALGLTGANGDGTHNTLHSVVISGIPDDAIISDGHGHTQTVTSGSLDVTGWNYTNLTIASVSGTFSLTATATEQDGDTPADISASQSAGVDISTSAHWTDAQGGAWSVAANWQGNAEPTSALDTYIDLAGPYTVAVADVAAHAQTLTFNSASVVLDVGSGDSGTLTVAHDVTIDTGTLNVEDTSTMTVGGNFTVHGGLVDVWEGFETDSFGVSGGTLSISGALVVDGGEVEVQPDTGSFAGQPGNELVPGTLKAASINVETGGQVDLEGNVNVSGVIETTGGNLVVGSGVSFADGSTTTLTFGGTSGTITLAGASGFANIAGFGPGDVIDLPGDPYSQGQFLNYNQPSGILYVGGYGIDVGTGYTATDFALAYDHTVNPDTGTFGTEVVWGLSNVAVTLSPTGVYLPFSPNTITVTVTVDDPNGNPVDGVTVTPTFTATSGGGEGAWQYFNNIDQFGQNLARTTNSQGQATFTFDDYGYAGTYNFSALLNGVETVTKQIVVEPENAGVAPYSTLTSVLEFAGPKEAALLTLTDRDFFYNPRPGDTVQWSTNGDGTFSPANGAANDVTDANGILVDTVTHQSAAAQTQTVSAAFDQADLATVSTNVGFVAMDTWINTSINTSTHIGVWEHTSDNGNTNWSNGVPTTGEGVWIGQVDAANDPYTVDVTQSETIFGIGTIATSTLKLDSGFTVNGSGISVLSGALTIDGGAEFLAENGQIELNGAVTNNGTLQIQDGAIVQVAGGIAGSGNIGVDGGHLDVQGSVAATEAFGITGAGVVELGQAEGGTVNFYGAGLLALDAAPAAGLTVNGFGLGDSIDLTNVGYGSAGLTWTQGNGQGTLQIGSETITLTGTYSQGDFALTAGPLGGADVVYSATPLNYAGGALWGGAIMTSPGTEIIGGVNNNNVAVITGDSGGQDYFYVNGHLITVSGAPLNSEGGIGLSLGSGINTSQEVVLTHEDTAGNLAPETFFAGYNSGTGLYAASGAALHTGPSVFSTGGQPDYLGQGLGINDGGIVVGEFEDLLGNEHGHHYFWGGVPTPYEYGFIYSPSPAPGKPNYIGVDAGNTITTELPSGDYFTGGKSGVDNTILTGINNEGIAVGYYTDSSGISHGFVLNTNNGAWDFLPLLVSPSAFSDSTSMIATGINDEGVVVGYYDPTPTGGGSPEIGPFGGGAQSFVYQYDASTNTGSYLNVDFTVPGISSLSLLGINNNGMVTGETGGDQLVVASVQPSITIDAGGTYYITDQSYNIIHFASSTGELVLDSASQFHGTITGFSGAGASFSQSDVIDLVGYNFLNSENVYGTYQANGILHITNNGGATADINFQSYNGGFAFMSDGQGGMLIFDPPAGPATIVGGEVYEVTAADSGTVTFADATGKLQLDDPSHFTGSIAGFTGTDTAHSGVVDLSGVDFNSANFAETYHAATGVLSVTDGTNSANITFDNFNGALDFASDGHGGTAITDAPADAAANPLSTAGAQGTLSFADNDAATDLSANVAPDGQNYVGHLTTSAVTESNGTASIDYSFSLGNDQINVAPGQTVTQSYQVSLTDAQNPAANATQTVAVSIGGAGNDNFVFAPGVGHDTVLNFNAQQDTVELDHFANAQTVQELQSLITADTHGNAVLDLGSHDSITFLNTTQAQLQQAAQNGHVLLH